MKNLTKSLIAASFLLAGSAMADADVEKGSGSLEVTGHVPLKCTVNVGDGLIDMGHNPVEGVFYPFTGTIDFQCNAKKGANISLTSKNSGLAHRDAPNHKVNYEAWLKVKDLEEDTMNGHQGKDQVELICKGGEQNSNILMTGFKDRALAMPNMVTGMIMVNLLEPIKFAGYYDDTLTVEISAKI